ncbi:MAG: glycosyltransferase [Patescibacteria group bacterium]
MKLLIVTQKVDKNDDVLGFMHGWISEFAKHCEKVTVIALGVGEYDLPRNVKVLSLGKNNLLLRGVKRSGTTWQSSNKSRKKYIFNFYKYIWQERKNYDNVFVHMNPEYVVLGSILWRFWGKRVGLWYTHKAVNLKLRIAEKMANLVFSASSESFGLKSKKLHITGHGINLEQLKIKKDKIQNEIFKMILVGRIAPIKNQDILIKSAVILKNKYLDFKFKIDLIGGADSYVQREYKVLLESLVKTNNLENEISFVSPVANKEINAIYEKANLSLNLCPTGGADKVVLESMACELPVIVFNKTFENILPEELILEKLEPELLAEKIYEISQKKNLNFGLRERVEKSHNLKKLIIKILNLYYA